MLNREKIEEHPRSNMALEMNVLRSQEDYITHVSEESEGKVTKKLLQEFGRTENRISGALARLDDFLMEPLIQGRCGTAPETSHNAFGTNQGANEDDSQSEPHSEAGIFRSQTTQNSAPEVDHDMLTGVHEEVTYFSPSTSSGKQKKNRSTSKPQFRGENTPAMSEADQILLAFQQLANNNNSANFHINLNRISKLTTITTFDGNSENFELFDYFFPNEPQNS